MDNVAQWVLAQAYIARHRLGWAAHPSGRGMLRNYYVYNPVELQDEAVKFPNKGVGSSLYAAVLDYQKKTGIGWNS
jgi:hypothetical protein